MIIFPVDIEGYFDDEYDSEDFPGFWEVDYSESDGLAIDSDH